MKKKIYSFLAQKEEILIKSSSISLEVKANWLENNDKVIKNSR